MGLKKQYKEKLLDPRWQRRRLEIMNRDQFTCKHCGESSNTLNVHHKTYQFGRDPWDYPDSNFQTLCVDCHNIESDFKDFTNGLIHDYLLQGATYQMIYNHLEGTGLAEFIEQENKRKSNV
jgi:hypothetical protein